MNKLLGGRCIFILEFPRWDCASSWFVQSPAESLKMDWVLFQTDIAENIKTSIGSLGLCHQACHLAYMLGNPLHWPNLTSLRYFHATSHEHANPLLSCKARKCFVKDTDSPIKFIYKTSHQNIFICFAQVRTPSTHLTF